MHLRDKQSLQQQLAERELQVPLTLFDHHHYKPSQSWHLFCWVFWVWVWSAGLKATGLFHSSRTQTTLNKPSQDPHKTRRLQVQQLERKVKQLAQVHLPAPSLPRPLAPLLNLVIRPPW